ncbi:MAG: ABC transporter substrate-binding protein [Desulfobulbia bacterium]
MKIKTLRNLSLCSAVLAVLMVLGSSSSGKAEKLTLAVPGVPPIFANVVAYVAQDAGFFKKHSVEVEIKPINSGAAAAKGVASGSFDMSFSPSQFVVRMVSNAGLPIKAIWGFNNPDWLIGSMDGSKTDCNGIKGGSVGVDSKRGARWIQLNTYLARKCKLKIDRDVKTVPMSSNIFTAMAAGKLNFGVLHIDDVMVIEKMSGKKVHVVARIDEVAPGLHYLMVITREDTLAKKRDAMVRAVAALSEAAVYMADPANSDSVAKSASVTKREMEVAKKALNGFLAIKFWPTDNSGLKKERVEKAIANQVRVGKITKGRGGIKPDKKPVSYEQMVDLSVYDDAKKR